MEGLSQLNIMDHPCFNYYQQFFIDSFTKITCWQGHHSMNEGEKQWKLNYSLQSGRDTCAGIIHELQSNLVVKGMKCFNLHNL